jgi:hypothetical protein
LLKKLILASAACALLATPAAAQGLLTDWGIADMKTAITATGSKVTGSGTTSDGANYVNGETVEGMKFLAYGTVCSSTTKRCKGVNLSAGFTQNSEAEVDRREKEIDRMAVGVRNGGEKSLDVNRYIIFDNGITAKNLQTNIEVFLGIADDIWNGGGVD